MMSDKAPATFQAEGRNVGEIAFDTIDGRRWQVYAHKDEQRVVPFAPIEAEAWQEAVRILLEINMSLS